MTNLAARATALGAAALLAGIGVSAAIPAGATPRPNAAPACTGSELRLTNTLPDGAAGSTFATLLIQNVGHHWCTLTGYPGLDAVGTHGQVLRHAKREPASVPTVRIKPGHFASAVVGWTNTNRKARTCRLAHAAKATPPNTTATVRLPLRPSLCDLRIMPVQRGTGSNNHYAAAQDAWIDGSSLPSATEGRAWHRAVVALRAAHGVYRPEIAALRQLISLPNTNLTPRQQREFRRDVRTLDSFFQTPGLYR